MLTGAEFVDAMIDWERAKKELGILEEGIKEYVLDIGDTHVIGNVEAKYSSGRKSYNYSGAIDNALSEGILTEQSLEPFEETSIDCRSACKAFGINKDKIEYHQSAPSVNIRFAKKK